MPGSPLYIEDIMPRNLRTIKEPEYINVLCANNDKNVRALVVSKRPDIIVVELPQGVRLTLYKDTRNPAVFTCKQGGLEFQCKL